MARVPAKVREDTKECWACRISAECEEHHLIPQSMGGTDTEDNIIFLCKTCHDFIDRYRFQDTIDISWFMTEAIREPGPRWARLMLLEMAKLASYYFRYRNNKNHQ